MELFGECAEELAGADSTEVELPPGVQALVHAYVFAARAERFSAAADKRPSEVGSDATTYVEKRLEPWLEPRLQWLGQQEPAVEEFAAGSYAQAVATWALAEAWISLLRAPTVRPYLHDAALKRDYEARTRFYRGIDEATAVALARSREPLQRALTALARQGTLFPRHTERWLTDAVKQLTEPKRRDVPLFRVFPPELSLPRQPTPAQMLFERLPPHYAAMLVQEQDLLDAQTLASLVSRGLAPSVRRRLSTEPAQLWALAQLRLRLGLLSHERQQFQWAHGRLAQLERVGVDRRRSAGAPGELSAVLALADALQRGPEDASAWAKKDVVFSTVALLALDGTLSERERALARANASELVWASPVSVGTLSEAVRGLRGARAALVGTPYACSIQDSLDAKGTGSWSPFGPRARCEQFKLELATNPAAAAQKRAFVHCGPLAWRDQRKMKQSVLFAEHCEQR
jgi:hypothetical protein